MKQVSQKPAFDYYYYGEVFHFDFFQVRPIGLFQKNLGTDDEGFLLLLHLHGQRESLAVLQLVEVMNWAGTEAAGVT